MKIIGASSLFTCNETFEVLENGGIVIENGKIIEVGLYDNLITNYPDCDFVFYKDHVILPALINAHIHFEFSKNDTSFEYGNFGKWLDSVMNNRGEVLKDNMKAMQYAIDTQKKSGVGSVCAISSYDLDLELLLHSKLKVLYCHEVLGVLEENFEEQAISISTRLERTLHLKNPSFLPALAIHAPYSVNSKIAQYVIDLALRYNLMLSTHFLESKEEFEWLMQQNGYFKGFYEKNFNLKDSKPHFSIQEFLALFSGIKTLYTHCLYADEEIKSKILKHGSIVSCPRSNLLLSGKMGDNTIIATDGKSSNADVNLLDEVRTAFFTSLALHAKSDIESLAKKLIQAITCNPAKVLGFNNGSLESQKSADVAIFKLLPSKNNNVLSNFILNARSASRLLVNGCDIL